MVMRTVATKIILDGMRFYAYHGVMPQECVVGHEYVVNIELDVDFSRAMQTDNLEDTVSYADVYEITRTEMAIPSKLLEHLVGRIANAIFEKCKSVLKVKIRLLKQNPPMGTDGASAGVEAEFVND